MTSPASLARTLIESDRCYFELAAQLLPLPGAVLAVVPGVPIAAAGVVHRVDPDATGSPDRWVTAIRDAVRAAGLPLARVYLDGSAVGLEPALFRASFRRRVEVGFVAVDPIDAPKPITLRPVLTDGDWNEKAKVHLDASTPDGHGGDAPEWHRLERRRCETGAMRAFVAELDGQAVAAVCTLDVAGVVRNKNLVTHPSWQRRGVASAVLAALDFDARSRGCVLGTFAVEGSAGEALYRSLGMVPAVRQIEWSRG